MAVSVDRVYQTVNSLLNKYDMDYLSSKEFNLLAVKAQIDVFEGEFYDLKNALAQGQGMGSDWGDIADNIRDKIQIFEEFAELSLVNPAFGARFAFPDNYYRLTALYYAATQNALPINIEEVSHGRLPFIIQSPLTAPTVTSPIYTWQGNSAIVYPEPMGTSVVFAAYIRRPNDPRWVGEIVNGRVIFKSPIDPLPQPLTETDSVNFEVHDSNLPELVAHILAYSGLELSRPEVVNFAQGEEQRINQTEQ